jgi:hypothetical protein
MISELHSLKEAALVGMRLGSVLLFGSFLQLSKLLLLGVFLPFSGNYSLHLSGH